MKKSVEELNGIIVQLLHEAQEAGTDAEKKRALLAEAAAYVTELSFAKQEEAELGNDRIERSKQFYAAYLGLELNRNELDGFAALPLRDFSARMREIAEEYKTCAAPAAFGLRFNPAFQYHLNSGRDESVEYARERAGQIFRQMDRTWRVMGNSPQFNAAKRAIQSIAELDPPTQLDFCAAALSVKAYVSKNLQAAYSAVGRTRMACAVSFLKQIMDEKSFQEYCIQLNSQRGVKWTFSKEKNELSYERTNPRCFVPEEIGTVREVYQNARNRISALAQTAEAPSPRELAILTALRNLQAKSPDGENLVVEHEALQAEIEQLQANRYFRETLQRPRDELIMLALEGNLDTIQGWQQGLTQEQERRIAAERQRLEEEQRLREENLRRERENKQQEEENALEAARLEEEKRAYNEKHPLLRELYREQRSVLDEIVNPFNEIFSILEGDPAQKGVALAAHLIALSKCMEDAQKNKGAEGPEGQDGPRVERAALQKRVEALEKDEHIRKLGAQIIKEKRWHDYIRELQKQAPNGRQNEAAELYPAVKLGSRLQEEYSKASANQTMQTGWTVAAYYAGRQLQTKVNDVAALRANEKGVKTTVAAVLALREYEKKLGSAVVDQQFLAVRIQQLSQDAETAALVRQLMQPETNEELKQALRDQTNPAVVFGDFLETLSLKLKKGREGPEEQLRQAHGEKQDGLNSGEKQDHGKQKKSKKQTGGPRKG